MKNVFYVQVEPSGARLLKNTVPNAANGPWIKVEKRQIDELRSEGVHHRRWTIRNGELDVISEKEAAALPLRGQVALAAVAAQNAPKRGWVEKLIYISLGAASGAAASYFLL